MRKAKLAPFIISLFPKHRCYTEVFGGAAWILFKKKLSDCEVYNDINADLVNLFLQLKDNCAELQKKAYWLPYSRKLFEMYSKSFQDEKISDLEKAVRFLYINRTCFSGQYQAGFSAGPGSYPNWRTTFITKDLERVRERLDNVIIENLDFEECIKKYDRETTLFYLDPPYFAADATKYYKFVFTKGSHIRLQQCLSDIENIPEVKELYKGFNIIETPKIAKVSSLKKEKDVVTELCITNFELENSQLGLF